ncbi:peptidase inhibitor family I36 protein [Devosia sp. PTR5]|uniref:Peptidase inhibitor family I36 protein n=1 Tax=Devosia oryzisoli TaxID=2774138 RepID=A0A927IR38_9HYPH|nr:SH3 domain-containing protein [Devosia oryzisoli]MBD8063994.1 peptidase inhibitor family I36 protein [Devosia oryzisoli]
MKRLLLALGLSLASLAGGLSPAAADSPSGSHGWALNALTLSNGPGSEYDVTGQIPADVAIKVLRCHDNWCLVDGPGGRGWTYKGSVGFGQAPIGPLEGPKLNYASGGPGAVCFYTGTNYTGASLCAGPGQVFTDLALYHLDDVFSSVQVTGSVSVAACRDREFQSYCTRIVESEPVLHQYLRRNLSSVRVY